MTNKRITADEAASIGLITRVIEDVTLQAETDALAAQLATSAVRALGRTRTLLLSSFSTSLETQMELEARAIAEARRDPES